MRRNQYERRQAQPIRKTPTKEKQRPGIDIGDLLIETPFFGSYLSHLSEMATTRPSGSPVGERIGDLATIGLAGGLLPRT